MPTSPRPLLLFPIEMKKSWGAEHWLNATRPEARAGLHAGSTLADELAAEPALLGEWTRRLFGDELPIFTKLLRTDFPPLVHVGWKHAVNRAQLQAWLVEEQAGLRALFAMLDVPTKGKFDAFAAAYSTWATKAGQAAWRERDPAAAAMQPYAREPVEPVLERLRDNRARLVDCLNEVDLREEAGHLLLTSAGMVHAIFGLSHQFHAKDGSRTTLEALLGELRARAARGESDAQLRAYADRTDLAALRAANHAPPKNEGWLPVRIGDELLLVEPQQSSDTTYSIADFYTPFVWDGTRAKFRKGAATMGLSDADLAAQLDDIDFAVTDLDEVRHTPQKIASLSHDGVTALELVDDPAAWPFFTAHQLELDAGAAFSGAPAPGTFQQLVVLDGQLALRDARGDVGMLTREHPAFIPATLEGGYTLTARSKARLLVLSVPGPRRAFPAA